MLLLPPSVRIFVATFPVDMRRSFDGLSALARDVLSQDPLSGHLFVFFNKNRDRVKVLFWDRSGFCLHYKRLEKGTFSPPSSDAKAIELGAGELALILEGFVLAGSQRRQRFALPR